MVDALSLFSPFSSITKAELGVFKIIVPVDELEEPRSLNLGEVFIFSTTLVDLEENFVCTWASDSPENDSILGLPFVGKEYTLPVSSFNQILNFKLTVVCAKEQTILLAEAIINMDVFDFQIIGETGILLPGQQETYSTNLPESITGESCDWTCDSGVCPQIGLPTTGDTYVFTALDPNPINNHFTLKVSCTGGDLQSNILTATILIRTKTPNDIPTAECTMILHFNGVGAVSSLIDNGFFQRTLTESAGEVDSFNYVPGVFSQGVQMAGEFDTFIVYTNTAGSFAKIDNDINWQIDFRVKVPLTVSGHQILIGHGSTTFGPSPPNNSWLVQFEVSTVQQLFGFNYTDTFGERINFFSPVTPIQDFAIRVSHVSSDNALRLYLNGLLVNQTTLTPIDQGDGSFFYQDKSKGTEIPGPIVDEFVLKKGGQVTTDPFYIVPTSPARCSN